MDVSESSTCGLTFFHQALELRFGPLTYANHRT